MASQLFSPVTLRGLTLPNRIVVSPMCQYSAMDGSANDWHTVHLGQLALSGAGLLMIEATGIQAEGRITLGCLGLYSAENETALAKVLQACRVISNIPLGIQISHAGRKGSAQVPWKGGQSLSAKEGAWTTVAPSAMRLDDDWPEPHALDHVEIREIRDTFVATTERAARLGLDLIEVHMAHGYLLHQFLSPLSNLRTDDYGGDRECRMRFPLEVITAVRAVWPDDRPLGVRITGTDAAEGGLIIDDAVILTKRLKELGCDYVCVTSSLIAPGAWLATSPGYMVPLAARIKTETGMPTRAVGMIVDALQAEEIIASGQADMVALGRAFLDDPRWPWHAAQKLGVDLAYPPQYQRSHPTQWSNKRWRQHPTKPGEEYD